ncbi:MAG: hypothetical protein WC454_10060 [Phycisphaerae bacterium]|jgi:hypothetical protein
MEMKDLAILQILKNIYEALDNIQTSHLARNNDILPQIEAGISTLEALIK